MPYVNECTSGEANCSDTCTNTVGGFTCSCSLGSKLNADWKTCDSCSVSNTWGLNCVNSCNCGLGASACDPTSGCQCKTGYNGTYCTDINECKEVTSPCASKTQSTCINTDGSYICQCNTGYFDSSGVCQDINECTTNQFDCSQRCVNTEGSYECACRDGYKLESDGKTCTNIDECTLGSDNCQQVCVDTQGSYFCTCNPGFNLANDMKSCDKDSSFDPCGNAGLSNNCTYACRVENGNARCYCSFDYVLDPRDNSSCIALNNKLIAEIAANYTFSAALLDPSSEAYKDLKSDFENLLFQIYFSNVTGFLTTTVTSFESGSTKVNFMIIFTDDINTEKIKAVAEALVRLKDSGFYFGDTKYGLVTEPRINNIREPATCKTCQSNETCVILQDTTYHCRSALDEANSLFLQFVLNKDYQSELSDPLNITFATYGAQIVGSINSVIQVVNPETVSVFNFTDNNGNTDVIVALSFGNPYNDTMKKQIAIDIVKGIDDQRCLDLSGSCISLVGQTYLGDTTVALVPTVCLTCNTTQECKKDQDKYTCVNTPTTTQPTTVMSSTQATSNVELILGLGIGVPFGIILIIVIVIFLLYFCRKSRGSTRESSISEDPWIVRKAFDTFDSRISGNSFEADDWNAGRGNFFSSVPYMRNWEQSRNIVDSYPYLLDSSSPRDDEAFRPGPDLYRSEQGASNFDTSRDEFQTSRQFEQTGAPESNFSWDFLFQQLNPKAFKIQRPTVEQKPTSLYQDMSEA